MTTDKSKLSNQNTITGTTLTSWSRQQKLAMIAAFAILAFLLAVSARSKQSPKPALVAASRTSPSPLMAASTPASGATPLLTSLSPTAGKKRTAKKRPANVSYSDVNSGVSFLYPRKFALVTGDKAQPQLAAVGDVPMNFVEPGGVAVATVALPSTLFPGTDFEAAFFNVNVNRNISEEQCEHFAFVDTRNSDGEPVDSEKVKIGSTDMEMTSDFSANIMKQAETQYYHSYDSGACYEFVLGLGTEGFATEGGVEHVKRDAVFAQLEKILASVKIRPAEPQPSAEPTATGMGGGKE